LHGARDNNRGLLLDSREEVASPLISWCLIEELGEEWRVFGVSALELWFLTSAGALGPGWASSTRLAETAVHGDEVSWTRSSQSQRSKRCVLKRAEEVGSVGHLQVFDGGYGHYVRRIGTARSRCAV
jgi:hypothetical protein